MAILGVIRSLSTFCSFVIARAVMMAAIRLPPAASALLLPAEPDGGILQQVPVGGVKMKVCRKEVCE